MPLGLEGPVAEEAEAFDGLAEGGEEVAGGGLGPTSPPQPPSPKRKRGEP